GPARYPRQQARARRRHQRDGRRRSLSRRHRDGGVEDLRLRGGAHRRHRARGCASGNRRGGGDDRGHVPRRLFPGAEPITAKVVAERSTGRIVGAQIVGEEGAGKRIDVLATAIWNRMHVDEVASLDLSYAPPFTPVWDPVLVAARKAATML